MLGAVGAALTSLRPARPARRYDPGGLRDQRWAYGPSSLTDEPYCDASAGSKSSAELVESLGRCWPEPEGIDGEDCVEGTTEGGRQLIDRGPAQADRPAAMAVALPLDARSKVIRRAKSADWDIEALRAPRIVEGDRQAGSRMPPVVGGEAQAGSVGGRGAGHLWCSGRYKAEREHRGHGGDDGEHGVGVGEALDRGCAGETCGGDGGGQRDTDGGTELVEGLHDARDQPGLVQADAAEGRGGRAHEQRAAAQREHHDAGKGFDIDVAVCRHA